MDEESRDGMTIVRVTDDGDEEVSPIQAWLDEVAVGLRLHAVLVMVYDAARRGDSWTLDRFSAEVEASRKEVKDVAHRDRCAIELGNREEGYRSWMQEAARSAPGSRPPWICR